MRKNVKMTYISSKNYKGYMGHWKMSYTVANIIDIDTNKLISEEYTFKNSTIFKGKGFKFGDVIQMSVDVIEEAGKIKLKYFKDIKKL